MTATGLAARGWTRDVAEAWDRAFASATGGIAGGIPGWVVAEHRGAWDVRCEERLVRASSDAALRRTAMRDDSRPAVGDWVSIRTDAAGGRAAIVGILP